MFKVIVVVAVVAIGYYIYQEYQRHNFLIWKELNTGRYTELGEEIM